MTQRIFAKHHEVFDGLQYTIENKDADIPILVVRNKKNTLRVPAFSSVASLNGKSFDLGSVTVYIDKNDTFYLPVNLANKIK